MEFLVQKVHWLGLLGKGGEHVGHAVSGNQVHAQRHLVAGQDFLTRHVEHLQAGIHGVGTQLAADAPERVHARLQQGFHLAIDIQHSLVVLRHLHHVHEIGTRHLQLGAEHFLGEFLYDGEHRFNRHLLDTDIEVAFPIQRAGVGCEHLDQHAVFIAQADFARADLHGIELAFDDGFLAQVAGQLQVVGDAVLEARHRERKALDLHAAEQVEQPVVAGRQHVDKITFDEQQRAFVFFNMYFLQHHFFFSF